MGKQAKRKSIDAHLADAREFIIDERKRRGLTQAAVATTLGLSTSQYSRIETGSAEMSLRQFFAVCDALHVDPAVALRAFQPQYVADLQQSNRVLRNKLDAIAKALKANDA